MIGLDTNVLVRYLAQDDVVPQMKDIIDSMIATKELVVEPADTVRKALRVFVAPAKSDFADCLIERSGYVAECDYTVTSDVMASKVAGMKLIK
jgi:predicted nucleic-acid-binding protein